MGALQRVLRQITPRKICFTRNPALWHSFIKQKGLLTPFRVLTSVSCLNIRPGGLKQRLPYKDEDILERAMEGFRKARSE